MTQNFNYFFIYKIRLYLCFLFRLTILFRALTTTSITTTITITTAITTTTITTTITATTTTCFVRRCISPIEVRGISH